MQNIQSWLVSKQARPVRFLCVGGGSGLLQLGILSLVLDCGWNATLGNITAFLIAAQANFLLSSLFTWSDRPRDTSEKRSLLARWLTFHSSIASTAILNTLTFLVARAFMPSLMASASGIGVAAIANFVVMNFFVFRPQPLLEKTEYDISQHMLPTDTELSFSVLASPTDTIHFTNEKIESAL